MNVLFVTSEVHPFAQTGGLADVSAALPKALCTENVSTRVIIPLYGSIAPEWREQMSFIKYIYIPLAWRNVYCGLFELEKDGVIYYFIDNEYYFKRSDIYGHYDECERFAFFSRAVAALLCEFDGWIPDIIHCNDWQTALVPVYMRQLYEGVSEYEAMRTVFTIHNIEYQGRHEKDILGHVLGLPDDLFYNGGAIEYMGDISLMKGAILMSDWITTVSPTYAKELQYSFYAHGLEGVLAANKHKLTGILNGIDMEQFNPETQPDNMAFSAKDFSGKANCKAELQKLLCLDRRPDVPLIVMIGRLAGHKGIDLVNTALDDIMALDVQFAVLGRGDWHYEQLLTDASRRYEGRFSASILYSQPLAQSMYSGGDIFLMPSRAEPCGLAQMLSMRYGNVPVVRKTGGLCDTVLPYSKDTKKGSGFVFDNYAADDMLGSLKQAIYIYRNEQKVWQEIMKCGMANDFNWKDSAKAYIKLYKELLAGPSINGKK